MDEQDLKDNDYVKIPLSDTERNGLYIALQWPEDREAARKLVAPTNLTEVQLC